MKLLQDRFKELGYDNREFRQGQIFIAEDAEVRIPDERYTGRTVHPNGRPVVILYDSELNAHPLFRVVLAAPLSHELGYKQICDLELRPEDGVEVPCLLRLNLAQPFCKVDLRGPVGTLSDEAIDKMVALQAYLLGVSLKDDEEEEPETVMGRQIEP